MPAILARLLIFTLAAATGDALAQTPRVLIVASNQGTEITDLLVPFAVLSSAGAEVRVVAPQAGDVELWPALRLRVDTALEDAGEADLIIVPAVRDPRDQTLIAWLRERHAAGTAMASICDGVLVLAEAGLLDGQAATGHFYSHRKRVRDFPAVRWRRDRRWVEDGTLLTTAGVSASAPAAVRLVERLLGAESAATVAARYGIAADAEHNADDFRIGAREVLTAIGNLVRGLRKRRYLLPVDDGVDEYALAFTVDMLLRTSRVSIALAAEHASLRTAHGLTLIAEPVAARRHGARTFRLPHARSSMPRQEAADLAIDDPAHTIEVLRAHLAAAFGRRTEAFVATQLELP